MKTDLAGTAHDHGTRRAFRATRRGFTLVEVLVALTAGLMVSAAAYMLAQNAMKSFQDESRISSSQVGVALGMSRLTADLQRAGYMASPNVDLDPKLCPSLATWANDRPIAAVRVRDGSSFSSAAIDASGYDENPTVPKPDVIVITGNMTSAEQFEYRGINAGKMYLAANRGPSRRAFEDVGKDVDAFCEIFLPRSASADNPGRFARLVEPSGKESYVIVTSCDADVDASGDLDAVELDIIDPVTNTAPSTVGSTCGARPGGGLINPVSIIRYRLDEVNEVTDPRWAKAVAPTGPNAVTGEDSRLELVREEIAPDDAADPFALDIEPSARELVAEFAVDLDVSAVVANADPDLTQPQNLLYYATSIGGEPAPSADTLAAIAPQRFRSVRVRLGTRARVPDRDEAAPATGVTTRFLLPEVGARNKYARMRTLHADVALPNLQQVTW